MSVVNLNCPVCENKRFETFKDVFDDRPKMVNTINIILLNAQDAIIYPHFRDYEQDLGELYKKYYQGKDINYEEILKKS